MERKYNTFEADVAGPETYAVNNEFNQLLSIVEQLGLAEQATDCERFDRFAWGREVTACTVDRQAKAAGINGEPDVEYAQAVSIPSFIKYIDSKSATEVNREMEQSFDGKPPTWDVYRVTSENTVLTLWRRDERVEFSGRVLDDSAELGYRSATTQELADIRQKLSGE